MAAGTFLKRCKLAVGTAGTLFEQGKAAQMPKKKWAGAVLCKFLGEKPQGKIEKRVKNYYT